MFDCQCFFLALALMMQKRRHVAWKKNLFLSTYFIKGSFAYSLFGGNFIIWVWLVLHFHHLVVSVSYGPSDYKVKRFCTRYFSAFSHLFNILFFKKAFRILLQSKPSCFSQSDLRKHAMLLPQHHHFLFFSKKNCVRNAISIPSFSDDLSKMFLAIFSLKKATTWTIWPNTYIVFNQEGYSRLFDWWLLFSEKDYFLHLF